MAEPARLACCEAPTESWSSPPRTHSSRSTEQPKTSTHIAARRDGEAAAAIARYRSLLRDFSRDLPAFAGDEALAADDRFFAEYHRLIATRALATPETRRRAAQSLRYAAFAKLHTAVAGASSQEDSR